MILLAVVTVPLVIALIFSNSMMNGIVDKFVCLSCGHIKSKENVPVSEIVLSCDKTVSGYSLVYSNNSTSRILVKGVEDSYFNSLRKSQLRIIDESEESSPLMSLCISEYLADQLSVKCGDKIAMMSVPSDGNFKPRPVLCSVRQIFTTGYEELDKSVAFTDIDTTEKIFNSKEEYEIILSDDYSENTFGAAEYLNLKNYTVWQENYYSLYRNFSVSRQVILIILIMVTVMAAFYTAMVSHQIITDDRKTISELKLLGCGAKELRLSCFASVMIICVFGGIIGLAIGIILSYLIGPALSYLSSLNIKAFSYYLLDFKITIPWKDISIIMLCLMSLSSVSVVISLNGIKKISPMQLFTES